MSVLQVAGRWGGILALIALLIVLVKQLIALVGFIMFAIKIALVIAFIGLMLLIIITFLSARRKRRRGAQSLACRRPGRSGREPVCPSARARSRGRGGPLDTDARYAVDWRSTTGTDRSGARTSAESPRARRADARSGSRRAACVHGNHPRRGAARHDRAARHERRRSCRGRRPASRTSGRALYS